MTSAEVPVEYPAGDRRAEIAFQVSRLAVHLTELEDAARAAEPEVRPLFGWATFSLETGLTAAQEAFVGGWSPRAVLRQCSAQREMIAVLQAWVEVRPDPADLDLAFALVSTFGDALPERPTTGR